MDIGRRIGGPGLQKSIIIPDTGYEHTALPDPSGDALHRRFQVFRGEHMRQGIVHADDDVKGLGEDLLQCPEIRLGKPDRQFLPRCPGPGLVQSAFAEVGGCNIVAQSRKADGLSAYAAGAVQQLCRPVKAAAQKQPLQQRRLLPDRGMPVQKQLIILGRKIIVKSLCDIHRKLPSCRYFTG